jgi:hypothetical protein
MTLNIIFAFSGLVVAALIGAKVWEDKHRRKPFLLRWVSLSDEHMRVWSHELAHRYAEIKEEAHFIATKQLPLHTKNFVNKANATVRERLEKHIGDIRGSKFLKRSDGISEFFKSLEEKENGRIDDSLNSEEGSQSDNSEVK